MVLHVEEASPRIENRPRIGQSRHGVYSYRQKMNFGEMVILHTESVCPIPSGDVFLHAIIEVNE